MSLHAVWLYLMVPACGIKQVVNVAQLCSASYTLAARDAAARSMLVRRGGAGCGRRVRKLLACLRGLDALAPVPGGPEAVSTSSNEPSPK